MHVGTERGTRSAKKTGGVRTGSKDVLGQSLGEEEGGLDEEGWGAAESGDQVQERGRAEAFRKIP